jgi:hypothetical protein
MSETTTIGRGRGRPKGQKTERTIEYVCSAPGCPRKGAPFMGTLQSVYCSRRCNLAAWRARQREAKEAEA